MKIKDVRKMIKGLKGQTECEFQITYDCNYGVVGCNQMELRVEKDKVILFGSVDY